jgi:3,4-dihydroxy-2-butanone 4-phosphate synthase
MTFAKIEAALTAIRSSELVVVVADASGDGALIMSAQCATPEATAFMVRYTSGLVCVALESERVDQLQLPRVVESQGDAFTVSVDLKHGTHRGISAADRSATIRALANAASRADDFARPGHVFPLRSAKGGVLQRPGHTEAAVDLARLAGHPAAGAVCELVNDDGSMARLPELQSFAARHGFLVVSIADLVAYRRRTEAWSQPPELRLAALSGRQRRVIADRRAN